MKEGIQNQYEENENKKNDINLETNKKKFDNNRVN